MLQDAWMRINRKVIFVDRLEWEKHTHEEVEFWDKWFRTRGGQWPEDYLRRIDPRQRLPDLIEKALVDKGVERGSAIRILDLGSGPLTAVGSRSDRYSVEVVAIDPLADAYNLLIRKHGIAAPLLPQQGEAERLDCLFPPETFDLVWVCNSLDHSYDPVLGIFQAFKTLKTGGTMLIVFHPNEADVGNYQGLHNWNFDVRAGKFIIESRGRLIDMSEVLEKFAKIKVPATKAHLAPKSKLVVEVRKISEISLFDMLSVKAEA